MSHKDKGYILVTVVTLIALLLVSLAIYTTFSISNSRTSTNSNNASAGFYASEGGLNARAAKTRRIFENQQTPSGTSPSLDSPCVGSTNQGAGDFSCQTSVINGRQVKTFISVGTSSPGRIPPGDNFENLTAIETPYTVYSQSYNSKGNPEAITNLIFRSRLVPLFQFAVFFDKDLEFSNTAPLNLYGPVHTNGNLFLDSNLALHGQTSSGGAIYDGWKSLDYCKSGTTIDDAGGNANNISCGGARSVLLNAVTSGSSQLYGGRLKATTPVQVPTIGQLQPNGDALYWQKADARVVLKKSGTTWYPIFVAANGSALLNPVLAGGVCNTAVSFSTGFRDNREGSNWDSPAYSPSSSYGSSVVPTPSARSNKVLLDLDIPNLFACIQLQKTVLGIDDGLANNSDNGLVIYATVDDSPGAGILTNAINGALTPATSTSISQSNPPVPNNYGIRLKNGGTLRSSNPLDPIPMGITFVTDQAAFVQGNYNTPTTRTAGWRPSAILADSMNILSSSWSQPGTCRLGSSLYMSQANVTGKQNFDDPEASNSSTISSFTFTSGQTWNAYSSAGTTGSAQQLQGSISAGQLSTTPDLKSQYPLFCRLVTSATTIQTAMLAGTASTGDEKAVYNDANMTISGEYIT